MNLTGLSYLMNSLHSLEMDFENFLLRNFSSKLANGRPSFCPEDSQENFNSDSIRKANRLKSVISFTNLFGTGYGIKVIMSLRAEVQLGCSRHRHIQLTRFGKEIASALIVNQLLTIALVISVVALGIIPKTSLLFLLYPIAVTLLALREIKAITGVEQSLEAALPL